MALKIGNPNGFTSLLKEGYKHFEEAVYRNISACNDLCVVTRSSFGPHGMNKLIVNTLDKLFVTSDAATILRELEVVHPAAKLLVMASHQQEVESGDGTNFVLIFAGELLKRAEDLLKMGMHPSEIIEGYEKAFDKMMQYLETDALTVVQISPNSAPGSMAEFLLPPVQTALATKQYGYETFLSKLVIKAAIQIIPWKSPKAFNVDSIRVVKIMGGSILDSQMIPGMVFNRQPESMVQRAENAKIAIYSCPVDIGRTETKGTVLLHGAKELLEFSKGEEEELQKVIDSIADTGVRVIATGGTFGDLAMHYLNRHGIVAVKIPSKFDLQRLCRVTGATASARLGPLSKEEMGYCDVVECIEIGGDRVTVFRKDTTDNGTGAKTASILLRGSTINFLDDVERAIDDGVNVIKSIISKDSRLVPGAGATEVVLSNLLMEHAQVTSGLPQYAMLKFAEALQAIPKALAENSGLNAEVIMTKLQGSIIPADQMKESKKFWGVDIESQTNDLLEVTEAGILDVLASKRSALHLATDAALSVLRVDSIIMSKPAGGPKPKTNPAINDD